MEVRLRRVIKITKVLMFIGVGLCAVAYSTSFSAQLLRSVRCKIATSCFGQNFSAHRGFAAVLAERLCLSDLALKGSCGYTARGRASRKAKRIGGKPEAFRKDSGKAVTS